MSRKLTYEEVKHFIEIESNSGCKLLSDTYINAKTKLYLECKCSEKFYTTYDQFKNTNKQQCNKCGYENFQKVYTLTYDYVKNFIEVESKSGCKLLSEEYKNSKQKLKLQCKCENKFEVNFDKFKSRNKRQCDTCSYESRVNLNRLTYEEVKQFIEVDSMSGCELLSKDYVSSSNKLLFKCTCGKQFKTSYNHFQRGQRQCNDCGQAIKRNKIKLSYEEVKNKINSLGYELLSDTYKNNKSNLTIKCNKNHVYETTFDVIKNQGSKCPICNIENLSGEGNPNWRGGITNLNGYLRNMLNDWRIEVLQSYSCKCILTDIDSSESNLVVHHLVSFTNIVQSVLNSLNLDIKPQVKDYTQHEIKSIENLFIKHNSNCIGVPLLKEFHILFHQLYGYGDNTPEQFDEFKTRLKNGEFNDFLDENKLVLII